MRRLVEQGVAGRSLRALSDTKNGGDCLRHQIGRRERRQIDQPHAVGEFVTRSDASRTASRVFPTPPAPVSDSSRDDLSTSEARQLARRPTKLVSSAGRL